MYSSVYYGYTCKTSKNTSNILKIFHLNHNTHTRTHNSIQNLPDIDIQELDKNKVQYLVQVI